MKVAERRDARKRLEAGSQRGVRHVWEGAGLQKVGSSWGLSLRNVTRMTNKFRRVIRELLWMLWTVRDTPRDFQRAVGLTVYAIAFIEGLWNV